MGFIPTCIVRTYSNISTYIHTYIHTYTHDNILSYRGDSLEQLVVFAAPAPEVVRKS
jgi:hypothetical protein